MWLMLKLLPRFVLDRENEWLEGQWIDGFLFEVWFLRGEREWRAGI